MLSIQRFDWRKRDSDRRAYKGVDAQKYERKKRELIETIYRCGTRENAPKRLRPKDEIARALRRAYRSLRREALTKSNPKGTQVAAPAFPLG